MREIEVKILEIDVKAVIRRLKRLGARKVSSGELRAAFFDFKDRRLQKTGRLLRLREGPSGTVLAFKSPVRRRTVKSMREYELDLRDSGNIRAILAGLGLRESDRARKHRTSFRLGRAHFEIDKYPGIPAYLEIEAPSAREIRRLVGLLGMSMARAKPWTWRDVLAHYGKRPR